MGLGDVNYGSCTYRSRYRFCHSVKEVADDPVERLDQEGEFLEDAAVYVVHKARRFGAMESKSTASTCLEVGLRIQKGDLRIIIVVLIVSQQVVRGMS